MKLLESIRISWRAITGHKLRSTLTTLGIIIGIGVVIAFQVFGGGLQEDLLGDIQEDQDPLITVQTQTDQSFGRQTVSVNIYTQTDVNRLRNISGVEYVAPQARLSSGDLRYEEGSIPGGSGFGALFTVGATDASLFDASLFNMTKGEAFSAPDEAVVNEGLVELSKDNLSVGDSFTVKINGTDEEFTISGIVDDGDTGSPQPTVYVPLEYYTTTTETPRGTQERAYPALLIGAESFDQLESVQDRADDYLQNESDAQELIDDVDDQIVIQVQTIEETLEQFSNILDQITQFLAGIAALSLLVGSIGIANIMIVSVTERTREIGIMKAVGARKRDVIQLFLVEALILGVIGAIFGVLVGLGFGYIGVSLLGWPMVYPLDWIVIAVFVGIVVGVISGLYPAWRAARVDPIEALRRE